MLCCNFILFTGFVESLVHFGGDLVILYQFGVLSLILFNFLFSMILRA